LSISAVGADTLGRSSSLAPMTEEAWLNDTEAAIWLGLLRTWILLADELDRCLRKAAGISLAEYEVLAFLDASNSGSLRMSELQHQVLVSKTRLTHIVDRLEASGLVIRARDDADGRGVRARITPKGRRLQHRAAAGHVQDVRHLIIDHIPARLQRDLIKILDDARAALDDPLLTD
jgi:DNA-binding MarR family transcriptional regulator